MKITTGRHKGSANHGLNIWPLAGNSGKRQAQYKIPYGVKYSEEPEITIGLTAFIIENDGFDRIDVKVLKRYKTHFILGYRTWGDTTVIGAGVNWMAIGATDPSELDRIVEREKKYKGVTDENDDGNDDTIWKGGWEELEELKP